MNIGKGMASVPQMIVGKAQAVYSTVANICFPEYDKSALIKKITKDLEDNVNKFVLDCEYERKRCVSELFTNLKSQLDDVLDYRAFAKGLNKAKATIRIIEETVDRIHIDRIKEYISDSVSDLGRSYFRCLGKTIILTDEDKDIIEDDILKGPLGGGYYKFLLNGKCDIDGIESVYDTPEQLRKKCAELVLERKEAASSVECRAATVSQNDLLFSQVRSRVLEDDRQPQKCCGSDVDVNLRRRFPSSQSFSTTHLVSYSVTTIRS